jgi:hypothetical protein
MAYWNIKIYKHAGYRRIIAEINTKRQIFLYNHSSPNTMWNMRHWKRRTVDFTFIKEKHVDKNQETTKTKKIKFDKTERG